MIKFFKSLFLRKNSIKGASLILMATLVASNILGLFRDRFLAEKIPQANLDTYLAAFRIPDLIFNLLILGAITSAFIPVFINFIRKNQEHEAWYVTNSMINITIVLMIIIPGILAIIMPWITPILVPGFDHFHQLQTINLSRILLIAPLFFGLSYIFGGVLNSYKRFLVYSLSPLIYNVAIILATLLFADKFSVYGVAVGVVIGAFLHMLIQIPTARGLGYRFKYILDFKNKSVRRIGKLMIPRMIGLGSNQFILIFATFIASMWIGHVTYFNFANDIQTFFSVVFGSSFAIAVFPFLAEYAADNKKTEFVNSLNIATRQILYFTIPSVVLLILLRTEIVRLLLGTGYYDWSATVNTANCLGAFAIGIWSASLIQLLARAFYAYENTRIPAIIAVISAVFTIGLSFALAEINIGQVHILNFVFSTPLKSIGVAFAVSIGSILNVILLVIFLKKKFGTLIGKGFTATLMKYLSFGIVVAIVGQFTKMLIGNHVNMQKFFGVLTKTGVTIIVSFGVYYLLTYLFKCEELSAFFEVFKKKVSPPSDISLDQDVDAKQSQEE